MIDLTKLTAEELYNLVHDFPRSLDSDDAWPETLHRLRRLEKCEALQPKQRERIAACLKGEVFSENQWTKGYCAGIVAALTAFDDAARAALEN